MRKLLSLAIGAAFVVVLALPVATAADNEVEVSSDRSENPITGTVTETKKSKRKHKRPDGKTNTSERTEKHKIKKDGSTSTTIETESAEGK